MSALEIGRLEAAGPLPAPKAPLRERLYTDRSWRKADVRQVRPCELQATRILVATVEHRASDH